MPKNQLFLKIKVILIEKLFYLEISNNFILPKTQKVL